MVFLTLPIGVLCPVNLRRTCFVFLVIALLLFSCAGFKTKPSITKGQEPRHYTISPTQEIKEYNTIIITPDSIDKLIRLSNENLKKLMTILQAIGSNGRVQSMGVWSISVAAEVKKEESQTQETKSDAKADVKVSAEGLPIK